jgi:hypothetical protein
MKQSDGHIDALFFITGWLHGAEPFLRSRRLCRYSRTSQHFMEPEDSLLVPILSQINPCPKSHVHFLYLSSFIQRIRPGHRPFVIFRNKVISYGEELLAPRSTPKMEDHPLSAVRDCLYNIFAATLQTWRPSPASATWGRATPRWQGTHHVTFINSLHNTRYSAAVYSLTCIVPLVVQ